MTHNLALRIGTTHFTLALSTSRSRASSDEAEWWPTPTTQSLLKVITAETHPEWSLHVRPQRHGHGNGCCWWQEQLLCFGEFHRKSYHQSNGGVWGGGHEHAPNQQWPLEQWHAFKLACSQPDTQRWSEQGLTATQEGAGGVCARSNGEETSDPVQRVEAGILPEVVAGSTGSCAVLRCVWPDAGGGSAGSWRVST